LKFRSFWKIVLVLVLSTAPLVAQISKQSFQEITDEISQQYYAFWTSSQAEVIDVSIDDETFSDFDLIRVTIRFPYAKSEQVRTLAFLSDDPQSTFDQYRHRLKLLFRSPLVGKQDQQQLTAAGPSGYWTTTLDEVPIGSQVTISNSKSEIIARLAVADQFKTSEIDGDITVTELEPMWTRNTLLPGMPLERDLRSGAISLQVPISLDRIGVQVQKTWPLMHTRFHFAVQGGVEWYRSNPFSHECTFDIGIMRTSSVASWNIAADSLGAWWTQLQLGISAYVTGGVLVGSVPSFSFLYGASLNVQLTHQSSPHWYWGVSGGYRYRVATDWQSVHTVQSNATGIVLSPIVGWMW
jgi:hypothetical protein